MPISGKIVLDEETDVFNEISENLSNVSECLASVHAKYMTEFFLLLIYYMYYLGMSVSFPIFLFGRSQMLLPDVRVTFCDILGHQ